jgi:hypothetical protein
LLEAAASTKPPPTNQETEENLSPVLPAISLPEFDENLSGPHIVAKPMHLSHPFAANTDVDQEGGRSDMTVLRQPFLSVTEDDGEMVPPSRSTSYQNALNTISLSDESPPSNLIVVQRRSPELKLFSPSMMDKRNSYMVDDANASTFRFKSVRRENPVFGTQKNNRKVMLLEGNCTRDSVIDCAPASAAYRGANPRGSHGSYISIRSVTVPAGIGYEQDYDDALIGISSPTMNVLHEKADIHPNAVATGVHSAENGTNSEARIPDVLNSDQSNSFLPTIGANPVDTLNGLRPISDLRQVSAAIDFESSNPISIGSGRAHDVPSQVQKAGMKRTRLGRTGGDLTQNTLGSSVPLVAASAQTGLEDDEYMLTQGSSGDVGISVGATQEDDEYTGVNGFPSVALSADRRALPDFQSMPDCMGVDGSDLATARQNNTDPRLARMRHRLEQQLQTKKGTSENDPTAQRSAAKRPEYKQRPGVVARPRLGVSIHHAQKSQSESQLDDEYMGIDDPTVSPTQLAKLRARMAHALADGNSPESVAFEAWSALRETQQVNDDGEHMLTSKSSDESAKPGFQLSCADEYVLTDGTNRAVAQLNKYGSFNDEEEYMVTDGANIRTASTNAHGPLEDDEYMLTDGTNPAAPHNRENAFGGAAENVHSSGTNADIGVKGVERIPQEGKYMRTDWTNPAAAQRSKQSTFSGIDGVLMPARSDIDTAGRGRREADDDDAEYMFTDGPDIVTSRRYDQNTIGDIIDDDEYMLTDGTAVSTASRNSSDGPVEDDEYMLTDGSNPRLEAEADRKDHFTGTMMENTHHVSTATATQATNSTNTRLAQMRAHMAKSLFANAETPESAAFLTWLAARAAMQARQQAQMDDDYLGVNGDSQFATSKGERDRWSEAAEADVMDEYMVTDSTAPHVFSAVRGDLGDDEEYMVTDGAPVRPHHSAERRFNRLHGSQECGSFDGVSGANSPLFETDQHRLSLEDVNPLLFRRNLEGKSSNAFAESGRNDVMSTGTDGSTTPNVAVFKASRAGNAFADDTQGTNSLPFLKAMGPTVNEDGVNPIFLEAKMSNTRGLSVYFPEEDELNSSSSVDALPEPSKAALVSNGGSPSEMTSGFFRPNLGVARVFGARPSGRNRSSQLQNMFGQGLRPRLESSEPLPLVQETLVACSGNASDDNDILNQTVVMDIGAHALNAKESTRPSIDGRSLDTGGTTMKKDSLDIAAAFFRPNLGVDRTFGARPSGRGKSSTLQSMFKN